MTQIKQLIESTLVPHTAFATATEHLNRCFRYASDAPEPICLPIIGESRTGKSRCLENMMVAQPRSRTQEGEEIPVLYVRTPAKPTVKGLAEELLLAIGDNKFDKGTEQVRTNRLKLLMKSCKTKMLIVDEFQHFVDKGTDKVAYYVADWLKTLVDSSRVAIVVAGLPSCLNVLRGNEQLAGRFMAPVMMPRFGWTNHESREEFIGILAAFNESMAEHFDLLDLSSDEMAFRFYCATGGLIGYLAKILRLAVWMAVDQQRQTITLEDLAFAYQNSVDSQDLLNHGSGPFARTFSTSPTQDMLARCARIGVRTEQAFSGRGAKRRQKTLKEATA